MDDGDRKGDEHRAAGALGDGDREVTSTELQVRWMMGIGNVDCGETSTELPVHDLGMPDLLSGAHPRRLSWLFHRLCSAQALVRATPASQPGFDPAPLVAVAAREASSVDKATRR